MKTKSKKSVPLSVSFGLQRRGISANDKTNKLNKAVKTNKIKRRWSLILGIFVILLIWAICAGLYYHHKNQQAQQKAYQADKAKFAQVEADMQQAFKGAPLEKSCDHISRKFEEGELYCHVGSTSTLSAKNLSELYDKVIPVNESLVKDGYFRPEDAQRFSTIQDRITSSVPIMDIDYKHRADVNCYLRIDATGLFNNSTLPTDANNIKLLFKCLDETQQIYTLAE